MDPNVLLNLLNLHGYWIMLILMILEGPFVNFSASFAASLGYFNILFVYILAVLGDFIGDVIYYYLGKSTRFLIVERFFIQHLKIKKSKIKTLEVSLKRNLGKSLTIIKVTPVISALGLVVAGAAKIPTKKYLLYSIIISAGFDLIISGTGFLSGSAYNVIASNFRLGQYIILIFLIFLVFAVVFVRRILPKIIRKFVS